MSDVRTAASGWAPERTHAVVVGIERYDAGRAWDLDGPARDAYRFVAWLRRSGVPEANIALFVSPLDPANMSHAGLGTTVLPATREHIYRGLTGDLSRKQGELLLLLWGGHGIITAAGERRLFYADATQQHMLNLDLNSLLTALRSDTYAGLPRQICFVDACANYIDGWNAAATLPHETFSCGRPFVAQQQSVFLAAKAGDLARNLTAEQTGLFTRELLAQLEAVSNDDLPPDTDALAGQLAARFSTLRDEGATRQTPNYFAYRDWTGNEHTLGQPGALHSMGVGQASLTPQRAPTMTLNQRERLLSSLLACPTITNPNQRQMILQQVRADIVNSIPRDPVARVDVLNIVATCLRYAGALQEFIESVRIYEGASPEMQQLDETLRDLSARVQAQGAGERRS